MTADPVMRSPFVSTESKRLTLRDAITPRDSRPGTISRWEYALELSTVCDMGDIREMTIKELAKEMADTGIEAADKILLGQAYGVPNWLISGYKELAERGTPISRTEGQKLRGNTVAGLCQVREAAKERKRSRATFGQPQYEDIYDYEAHIRREFAQELGNAGMPASAGTRLLSTDNSAHVPLNFIPYLFSA